MFEAISYMLLFLTVAAAFYAITFILMCGVSFYAGIGFVILVLFCLFSYAFYQRGKANKGD